MKHKLPCKAYWDSFSGGIIKVEALEVTRDNKEFSLASGPGDANTNVMIKFRVTSRSSRIWKYGEILTTSGVSIFPRDCYHKTGIFTYRVDTFEWEN
jgi:hypothetical protein